MRRLFAALAVTAVVSAGFALPTGAAEPEPDHVVHAGAVPDDPLKPYTYQDYFPRDLKVHQGDRVRWEFPMVEFDLSFHTVTFASDADVAPWVRSDEIPGTLAWSERSFFTSGCGRPGQPVCVISDPTEFVSSGTPLQHFAEAIEPFDAVIDLPEGTYTYFCTMHHPVMQGTIEVVAAGVEVNNPAPEDFADFIAELTAEADALVAQLSQPTPVIEDGRRTWDVMAGASTREEGGVAVLGFIPSSLEVRAGDAVRWTAGDWSEPHGVTFPDAGDSPALAYFSFNCEFDAPDGGAPGVPLLGFAGFFGLPWCPPGGALEMVVTPQGAEPLRASGDAVLTPATVHNSGVLVPAVATERMRGKPPGSGAHFPSGFEANFPVPNESPFTYRCQVHFPIMGGSVTVQGG